MTYEEITQEDTITGEPFTFIQVDLGEGAFKSFPVDEANPEYVSWAIAEGLMEAPEVVEPALVEPEVVAEPDPAP